MYKMLEKELESLCASERNFVTNASNFAALLFHSLEGINWAGFYFMHDGALKLGPFQGKPACIDIPAGKGVCGTAVALGKALVVPDVHEFPGHIACDAASRSEIVIPMFHNGSVAGVLDIDSPLPGRFNDEDLNHLAGLLHILMDCSDIGPLNYIYKF